MDKVSDMLLEQLNTVSFMEPSVSVLSNYTAQIYPSDAKQARQILALQTSNPVLWQQTVRYLLCHKVHLFIEMGSQPILTRISPANSRRRGNPSRLSNVFTERASGSIRSIEIIYSEMFSPNLLCPPIKIGIILLIALM